jgi:hypothetical protein
MGVISKLVINASFNFSGILGVHLFEFCCILTPFKLVFYLLCGMGGSHGIILVHFCRL